MNENKTNINWLSCIYNIHQLKDTYLANKKPTKKQVKVLSIFR